MRLLPFYGLSLLLATAVVAAACLGLYFGGGKDTAYIGLPTQRSFPQRQLPRVKGFISEPQASTGPNSPSQGVGVLRTLVSATDDSGHSLDRPTRAPAEPKLGHSTPSSRLDVDKRNKMSESAVPLDISVSNAVNLGDTPAPELSSTALDENSRGNQIHGMNDINVNLRGALPITQAPPGYHSESDVPTGDEVVILTESTPGEETAHVDPVPKREYLEDELTELGEEQKTAPSQAGSKIERRFNNSTSEEEKLHLLVMANGSADAQLAARMIAAALRPSQPTSVRAQALEYAFYKDRQVALRYLNDKDPVIRFNAHSLLEMDPPGPDLAQD
ncbi:MAG: hypothetical protein JNJ83_21510 [Verrucomicrobiaceae bacterium]|nr:hypothetical protein [Verrucomicrobiaceae bacterium]